MSDDFSGYREMGYGDGRGITLQRRPDKPMGFFGKAVKQQTWSPSTTSDSARIRELFDILKAYGLIAGEWV